MVSKLKPWEKTRAIRISQCLQKHFDSLPISRAIRSDEAYEILLKQGLVEYELNTGLHFREFLRKLKAAGSLDLIPQLRMVASIGKEYNAYYFESTPTKTKKGNLIPLNSVLVHSEESRIITEVSTLPRESYSELTPNINEIRKHYPRAYCKWTEKENSLLKQLWREIQDEFYISKILLRQPSAILLHAKELGLSR